MANSPSDSSMKMWLPDPLSGEVKASLQRLSSSDDVWHVAVMPDVHLAGDVCNGTVIATKELVYPIAVGADIGCGMLAVRVELEADALSDERSAGQVLSGLYRRIPSLKHTRANCLPRLPESLVKTRLSHATLEKQKDRDGLFQLGTLGRGNHFVEFQSETDGQLWLMLHSGSRGIGQAIAAHHSRSTQLSQTRLGFLDATTVAGQDYLSDVDWAIEYANENRLAMARVVESLIRKFFAAAFDWSTLIHCHHNHVRRETHFGEQFWIHRKGSLSAADQEPGVIPGSMGTRSYHVTGRGVSVALRSSSHGAGRLLTRTIARHQVSQQHLKRQMHGVWFDASRADELRDEAPAAYKEVGRVMRAQQELIRIVRQLRPLLVYKGN